MDRDIASEAVRLTSDDYKRINTSIVEELNSLLCDASVYDTGSTEYWEERNMEIPLSDDGNRQIIVDAELGIFYHVTSEDSGYFTGTGCGGEVEVDDWDVCVNNAELYDIRTDEWVPVDIDRAQLDLD